MRLLALAALVEWATANGASNDTLLWGPYRPNLYFGLRPRIPKSISTSLMWARVEDFMTIPHNVRYTCEQHEGMAGYGWDVYDPRSGGIQTIHDRGNGIDLATSFVKLENGGWAAKIKGTPRNGESEQIRTSVWFTVANEGPGSLEVQAGEEEDGITGDVLFIGHTDDLGNFQLKVTAPSGNEHPMHVHPAYASKPLDKTFVHSLQVPNDATWQAKALLFASMRSTIEGYVNEYTQEKMPPPYQAYTVSHRPGEGNFHILQKVFEGPFEFDVVYTPSNSSASPDVAAAVGKTVAQFSERFLGTFEPQPPFTSSSYLDFSKNLFSNLVGGIGYFYGDQLVDRSYDEAYEELNEGFWQETEEARAAGRQKLEGPYELYTSVPSRPFFPRGFLWDEGFHLLPIVDWDPELAMQIVSSWFKTMDEEGWIAREQILGPEARTKVPEEFQVQYPHYANPPTLFMVLDALLDKGTDIKQWLTEVYPLLQRNFEWYRKTQRGDLRAYDRPAFSSKEGYRWRGRTPRHILTSGLDDYPRAQPPHPGELHADLISWMGMMASTMSRVAKYIGEADDSANYDKIAESIRRNVDDLHWDEKEKAYCDVTVDDYEESIHVCHKGYISIFPFMTGLVGPQSDHLKDILNLIGDKEELWSPHGIRSLSKKDELYMTDENYWRSPVWMNMNYLIVRNLHNIATQPGPHRAQASKLYTLLRHNLIKTVYTSWVETGFAWEQYNPETGSGQRTQHFTGWTSLIVKIMSMSADFSNNPKHDEL
ncbi:glycoside hydrolase family 63 protein [Piedraia hortae CBS 480.64]|uniref:Mannosyl-oligosaccharide glucosidase n=1 Tax=Piedraia hortae CBS 480.64 TaxID=1314780 RepID=A0A6A7C2Q4_9PEZI|nr:glycoside hydrolase family 63 protein [Piedraia hortae CBS 480.64]